METTIVLLRDVYKFESSAFGKLLRALINCSRSIYILNRFVHLFVTNGVPTELEISRFAEIGIS